MCVYIYICIYISIGAADAARAEPLEGQDPARPR